MMMVRSLFFREYRSGLVVDVVVPLVVISVFAAAGKNPQLDLAVLIVDYLLPIVVALGFITGERGFPPVLKDRYDIFLRSFPVARSQVWLAITLARFLASLVGLGLSASVLALVARNAPFVISTLSESFGTTLTLFLVSYLFGGVWSLLIRRALAVYFFGLPLPRSLSPD